MAVSKRLRYEILRRDNHACRYCGATAPSVPLRVDHVVPVALGGTDDPTNLVTSCEPCNSGKSSSAPDASLIASASNDQLRWALAMKQAAEAAAVKRSEMDDYRSAFRKEWDQWTSGGKPFDLPGDWTITMDRFHNAGLPAFMWDEIVTKAMTNQRVDDLFKYICGIAWNKVTELHNAARQLLKHAAPPASTADADESEDKWSLLGDLLPLIGQERYESTLADMLEVEEDPDDLEIKERAASTAIWIMLSESYALEQSLRKLLTLFPANEVGAARDSAEELERDFVRFGNAVPGARLWSSTAQRVLAGRARAAASAMPNGQLSEWVQFITAAQGDRWNNWGGPPTEAELNCRAGEAALATVNGWTYEGMCELRGQEIEVCPRRAKTEIVLPGCDACGIAPSPPEGTKICADHFELHLAGNLCKHGAGSRGGGS